jgi:hypothetical protein
VVDQITGLFRTTHKVKTQQLAKSRGHRCGDIELGCGRSSDPNINGHLHYPNDLDGSLNEDDAAKIRQYRTDYNNRPSNSISFMTVIASTSGCLHSELVRLLFLQTRRETDLFLQFQEFS